MAPPILSSQELVSRASEGLPASSAPFPASFPPHKRIPGTRFVVDGFSLAGPWSSAYFLSHFHSDHHAGLTASWDKGIIFCSEITRRLVVQSLNVKPALVVQLPLDTLVWIDGCRLALVDANHCPGAVQMLFEVEGRRFVHTGDMRFSAEMKSSALLCNFVGADAVFLDTTYCHPRFCFPPQEQSISYVADTIHAQLSSKALFLIATYVVGKEKLLSAVASKCRCKLYVSHKKLALLKCLELEEELMSALVTDPAEAWVHVVRMDSLGDAWPFFRPNFDKMERLRQLRGCDRVVGFFPTGWTSTTASLSVRRKGPLEIHLVPYSEHSSYEELKEYVGFLRPMEIVPTVGNALGDDKAVASMREHFRNLVDETASKRSFLRGFKRKKALTTTTTDAGLAAALGKDARKLARSEKAEGEKADWKMQLQSLLPGWVTQSQMVGLYVQASGDLSAAVSLFFEQQDALKAESGGDSSSTPVKKAVPGPPSLRFVQPKRVLKPKSKGSRKKGAAAPAQSKSQPSILSFFKKRGPSPPQSHPDDKLKQLQSILGQETTEVLASQLLDQAVGDVAGAVGLFYDSKAGVPLEQSCSSRTAERRKASEAGPASIALPLSKYDPNADACWFQGEPAPYLHLARTFDMVEKEKSRLRRTEMLCNMFRSLLALSPDNVLAALYLTSNRIAPDHLNVDLNVGFASVLAAIEEATGTPRWKLKDLYNEKGDLGDVAQACRQNQVLLVQPRSLSIERVFVTLKQISEENGNGSGGRKKNLMISLLRCCREKEVTYLVRTLVRNLRIGAMDKTVLPALARAVVLHQHGSSSNWEQLKAKMQEASTGVVQAYDLLPDFDRLVPCLLNEGLPATPVLSPGIPMKPMLAKIAKEVDQLFKHFNDVFTCEFKFDGCRAQIHHSEDGSVEIFSRNCENATSRFPDVVDIIKATAKPGVRSFIVDAELVAVDRTTENKLLAFQTLSTRERGDRKGATAVNSIKVDVCIFVFDLMYLDSESLVNMPLWLRRQKMHDVFPVLRPGYIEFATEMTVNCEEASMPSVGSFLNAAIAASCEGLLAKALDEGSEYKSGRGDAWLKLKRDYVDGLSDSVDLVPIGAWHGNGRKAGWYSPFLLACYDPDKEEFQSVCRVMSGIPDAFYEQVGASGIVRFIVVQITAFYNEDRILARKPPYYRSLDQPDVWLAAECVWEIRGADFTLSPTHGAAIGLVDPERGISMRFPRFIRERLDKRPEDASPPTEICRLFEAQSRKAGVTSEKEAEKCKRI